MEKIGISKLSSVPHTILRDVVLEVLKFLSQEKSFIDLKFLREKAEATTEKIWSEECLQAIVNQVIHIVRVTDKLNLEKDSVATYLKKTHQLPVDIISLITSAHRGKENLSSNEIQAVDLGQVVDIQWKAGVSISSKNCKTLNCPFVTISLTLVLPGGKKCNKTFEMSITEFQNFHEQLLEMAAVLATV